MFCNVLDNMSCYLRHYVIPASVSAGNCFTVAWIAHTRSRTLTFTHPHSTYSTHPTHPTTLTSLPSHLLFSALLCSYYLHYSSHGSHAPTTTQLLPTQSLLTQYTLSPTFYTATAPLVNPCPVAIYISLVYPTSIHLPHWYTFCYPILFYSCIHHPGLVYPTLLNCQSFFSWILPF